MSNVTIQENNNQVTIEVADPNQTIVQIIDPIAEERLLVVEEEPRNVVNIEEEGIRIVQVGSQGPPGGNVPGNWIAKLQTYIHRQDVPSDTWIINHNLDSFPSVSVVDSAEEIVVMDVEYVNRNSLICTSTAAFAGKAYLN
jgi:hypothetical protein